MKEGRREKVMEFMDRGIVKRSRSVEEREQFQIMEIVTQAVTTRGERYSAGCKVSSLSRSLSLKSSTTFDLIFSAFPPSH